MAGDRTGYVSFFRESSRPQYKLPSLRNWVTWRTDWLTDWLTGWLTECLTKRLAVRLFGNLTQLISSTDPLVKGPECSAPLILHPLLGPAPRWSIVRRGFLGFCYQSPSLWLDSGLVIYCFRISGGFRIFPESLYFWEMQKRFNHLIHIFFRIVPLCN